MDVTCMDAKCVDVKCVSERGGVLARYITAFLFVSRNKRPHPQCDMQRRESRGCLALPGFSEFPLYTSGTTQ